MSDSYDNGERPSEDAIDSGEHFRAVAEAATDAIITINSQSTILVVNPAAERIFGYSMDEMLGRQLTMLMPEYYRHLHRRGIGNYLMTGKRHVEWGAVQVPGLHRSGREIPLNISFLEFVRNGQRFFTGIVREVAQHKPHGDAGRDNDELFSAIVNQTSVGISVVDMNGHFTFANERFCHIVRRPREELLKISPSDITHADDLSTSLSKFERARDFGESFEIEKRYIRPNGEWVWVYNYESVLTDPIGERREVMAITLDISERKTSEADLQYL
jgi:PAS domain S-box-containing protein